MLHLFSSGPSELKLQITITTDKTVRELKEAIADKSDVEADRQRLIYSGLPVATCYNCIDLLQVVHRTCPKGQSVLPFLPVTLLHIYFLLTTIHRTRIRFPHTRSSLHIPFIWSKVQHAQRACQRLRLPHRSPSLLSRPAKIPMIHSHSSTATWAMASWPALIPSLT